MNQRLEDYLATLSESEKIQYKDLIAESRQRDLEIKNNCAMLKKGMDGLISTMRRNAEAVAALHKALNTLRTKIPVTSFRDYPPSYN